MKACFEIHVFILTLGVNINEHKPRNIEPRCNAFNNKEGEAELNEQNGNAHVDKGCRSLSEKNDISPLIGRQKHSVFSDKEKVDEIAGGKNKN